MTTATDNLNAKIDDLTSAVSDALAQMETEVEAIKTSPADDSTSINASADRISSLAATIRTAMGNAKAELAAASSASTSQGNGSNAPASASTAAAVPLAGVPVTPLSDASGSATGPAVPSTDAATDPNAPYAVNSGAVVSPAVAANPAEAAITSASTTAVPGQTIG